MADGDRPRVKIDMWRPARLNLGSARDELELDGVIGTMIRRIEAGLARRAHRQAEKTVGEIKQGAGAE